MIRNYTNEGNDNWEDLLDPLLYEYRGSVQCIGAALNRKSMLLRANDTTVKPYRPPRANKD